MKATGDFGEENFRAVWVESDFRVYSSSEISASTRVCLALG